jgi:galactokinase
VTVERRTLAAIAKRAENDFVGAPTGIIDQYAALLCQEGHAMLLDCATLTVTQVPFAPAAAGANALIIDTRVAHALVSGEYAQRRAQCEEAARLLGVPYLGAVQDPAEASRLADPVLRRRARHVVTDSARARAIASALLSGSVPAAGGAEPVPAQAIYRYIGRLLTEAHASLRDDFEVSWPAADVTVEVAVAAGALGARMIGGGFGGSVLALIPVERIAAVRAALTDAFMERGWTPPEFIDAIPSAAARQLA